MFEENDELLFVGLNPPQETILEDQEFSNRLLDYTSALLIEDEFDIHF